MGSWCIFMRANVVFFLCTDTATTEIYTLSLHDALPICQVNNMLTEMVASLGKHLKKGSRIRISGLGILQVRKLEIDRKSTRLNSSHPSISYAVFCLKKKTAVRR